MTFGKLPVDGVGPSYPATMSVLVKCEMEWWKCSLVISYPRITFYAEGLEQSWVLQMGH